MTTTHTTYIRDAIQDGYRAMGLMGDLPTAAPTQAPPALPGEMPWAYLVRVGDSPDAVAHSIAMEAAMTDADCEARHAAALAKWRGYRCEEWIGCGKLTPNTGDFDVAVFYRREWVGNGWVIDVEAIYEPFSWEDLTPLVSNAKRRRMESRLEEMQDHPDPGAERADAIGDYRLNRMRDEQD